MKNKLRKNTFEWNKEEKQLNYLKLPALFAVSVNQSDKDGVIWCDYCFKDNVPVLTVYLKDVEILTLCKKCIGKIFSQFSLENGKNDGVKENV